MVVQRVLIVLASANRRGAEIEGAELAGQLRLRGVGAEVAALTAATTGSGLPVDVLGQKALGVDTLRALRRRARDADMVIAYGSTTLPACAIALFGTRKPFVYRSIGDPSRWTRGGLHRLRTALLFHRASRVVALWPAAADAISELYRFPRQRISVVANARDGARFRPPTPEERRRALDAFGFGPEEPVVGIVGALSEEKRPVLAVEAALLVEGAHVIVAGDGPLRTEVDGIAARSSGRVSVLGSVDDVLPVLHAIDVLLIASRTEGMPGSLIEAQLCGVPVVATDVGAVTTMVSDQSISVPVSATAAELAIALRTCLSRDQIGNRDERFTFESVAHEWLAVLESMRRN